MFTWRIPSAAWVSWACTEILEVGPGKALSGFVKKTLGPDVPCTAVETAEELAAFLTKWKEAHA